jgi:hypothetical protein
LSQPTYRESILCRLWPVRAVSTASLHDATEVARFDLPTVMMFVQSLHDISHNKIEDARE